MHDRWYRLLHLGPLQTLSWAKPRAELVCDGWGVPGVGRAASGAEKGALGPGQVGH